MRNKIINILKRNPFILLFLFCFFINGYFCSANENIKKYMEKNNMNYPYNLNTDINKSYFLDMSGRFIPRTKLNLEQINLLIPFFSELEVINKSNNFIELKNQKGVIAFSIIEVYIGKETPKSESIYVSICFYSDKNIEDKFKYDDDNKFWYSYNKAVYSIDDYKFKELLF